MHFCTPVKVLQRTCRNLMDNLSHLSVRKPQSTPSEMLLPGGCHIDRGQRSHLTKLLPKRTNPPPAALPEEQGACFNSAVVRCLLPSVTQQLKPNYIWFKRRKKNKTIITFFFFLVNNHQKNKVVLQNFNHTIFTKTLQTLFQCDPFRYK